MDKHYFQNLLPHELSTAIANAPVAYLPLGTLEYHGPHLAIGNDALKAQAILERVCDRCGGVIVPTLYWGIGGGHKAYPTSIIVRDHLLGDLLDDIFAGLAANGFRTILALTGHYSGEQLAEVRAAAGRFRQAHPVVHLWALPEYEAYPGEYRGDHAAKWETSILQYLQPELVDLSRLAGADVTDAPAATRSLEEMDAPGPLHGILGENPAKTASPALGKETVDRIVETLSAWVQNTLKN